MSDVNVWGLRAVVFGMYNALALIRSLLAPRPADLLNPRCFVSWMSAQLLNCSKVVPSHHLCSGTSQAAEQSPCNLFHYCVIGSPAASACFHSLSPLASVLESTFRHRRAELPWLFSYSDSPLSWTAGVTAIWLRLTLT